ncbi:hypothetical protein, partial [Serratia marcescens]
MAPLAPELRNRKPLDWGIRVILALVAVAIGYTTVRHSVAMALPERSLERAHELAPGDGRIAAELARRQFTVQ